MSQLLLMIKIKFRGKLRLPTFAVPSRYDLRLRPDLVELKFDGSVKINVDVVSDTAFLVLNAAALNVTPGSVRFRISEDEILEPIWTGLFEEDQILVLEFSDKLPLGAGVLSIDFQGTLNDELRGFYRSAYGPGISGNIAATQFEPIDARRMFPCWDEPAFKATFKITLDVPSDLLALSNMPIAEETINGNIKTLIHQESPIMSTYLVAVVVGSFDFVEGHTGDGVKVRVYCPVGKSEEGKFALNIALKTLDIYKEFFSVPYTLPKLDLIGIPDFAAGGMENYGLITFALELLYVNQDSEARDLLNVANVVTHELGHMWTGDLVTMEWWTDLWLNEGFASWLATYAVGHLFPEWNSWTQFLQSSALALSKDGKSNSHPIEVPIKKTSDINEVLDTITYDKGSAILQMLHTYLGPDKFQRSIASYIQEYSWSNANTDDLWAVLTRVSGMPVKKVMSGWTKQQGYPVISVKADNNSLEFKQAQFLSTGSRGHGQWIVPITLCCGFYDTCHSFLLSKKSQVIDMKEMGGCSCTENGACPWIKVNTDQTGFYRVKYEEEQISRLLIAVEKHELSASDRFGVLDDLLALSAAYHLPLASLLTSVDSYTEEDDYVVLSNMRIVSNTVARIAADATPQLTNCVKKIFINIFEKSAQKLGWDPKQDDSLLDALMRGDVLYALALLRHDATLQEATRRFHAYLADRNNSFASSDTRRAAFVAVMQNVTMHNQADYLSLLTLYNETDDYTEKSQIIGSLTTCPDSGIVSQTLEYLLTSGVPLGYSYNALGAVSWEGREAAWIWLKDNWETLSRISRGNMGAAIDRVIPKVCSCSDSPGVQTFFFISGQIQSSFIH
uniref:Aminopeptidase n=1 Tax=Kalanchoe fedtschenkoi TaxID=63787 RepID=A0A7N0V8D3_KALFE